MLRNFLAATTGIALTFFTSTGPAAVPPLELVRSIALPDVEGRIDHMAIDLKGRRLFVAALGNNSLEVIDLNQGKRVHSIGGLREPQGVVYLSEAGRLAVANGDDGTCRFFDGRDYRALASIDCKSDADNLRHDEKGNRLHVGCGKGMLTCIDLAKMAREADIPLAGHPESFQLERQGDRAFVNVPSARRIEVVDRVKQRVVATWPLEDMRENFPMALDEANHRLFIGCRKPARLLVIDTQTGERVAALPCAGDADDVFHDSRLRRIYVSGGDGIISVFQQDDDRYRLIATVATAAGARTSLWEPTDGRLYVAVPHRGNQRAEIREYKAGAEGGDIGD